MTAGVSAATTVAFVIPAFNEEANLPTVLDACVAELGRLPEGSEVIVVDDDSTDSTPEIVRRRGSEDPRIRLIMAGANIGANAAILMGMKAARTDVCFFIPGDRQVMPDQVHRCLPRLADADYVCTNRRPRADAWHRRLMAGLYNALVRRTFHLPTHDVDSCVLIRRHVIETIAPTLSSGSDFLPVEMLVRARRAGFRITEVVIEHHPRVAGTPSAIRPVEVVRTLFDLMRAMRRLRRLTAR